MREIGEFKKGRQWNRQRKQTEEADAWCRDLQKDCTVERPLMQRRSKLGFRDIEQPQNLNPGRWFSRCSVNSPNTIFTFLTALPQTPDGPDPRKRLHLLVCEISKPQLKPSPHLLKDSHFSYP